MPELVDIVAEAAELRGEGRDAFLDEACDGRPDLRAEVESLLLYHRAQTLIATRPGARPAPSVLRSRWHPSGRQGRRRLAAVAAGMAVGCAMLGVLVLGPLRTQAAARLESAQQSALDVAQASLVAWFEDLASEARGWAARPEVRQNFLELARLTAGRDVTPREAETLAPATRLRTILAPLIHRPGMINVHGTNRERIIVFFGATGTERDRVFRVNTTVPRRARVYAGQTVVMPPHPTGGNVVDGEARPERAQMLVLTPITDDDGLVAMSFSLRFDPEPGFTEALTSGFRLPATDLFAFNDRGLLLSRSAYTEELSALGLIPPSDEVSHPLTLTLRDPGRDLTGADTPVEGSTSWPLTAMATAASSGRSGQNLEGYRDVRGVRVAGAWRWLPDADVGIAVETDLAAAFALPRRWRTIVWGATAGFVVVSLLLFLAALPARSELTVRTERLGRYQLKEKLGEGGMANVYRAEHDVLRHPVAIKLLKSEVALDDAGRRFEREVRLVSSLSHPHTVRVFDYGQTTDGTVFYVMELVDGQTLSEAVRNEGPLPARRVVSVLGQICAAMTEAHDAGIVHRDLKPSNVMIGPAHDGTDFVKVLDFGLARSIAVTTRITDSRLLGGTPTYIAPERISEPDRVDPRSDIYSLGALAFFVLTGTQAVEGESPDEIMLSVLHRPRRRPSDVVPSVPGALDDLVLRCLARLPEGRPQSMREIGQTLDALS